MPDLQVTPGPLLTEPASVFMFLLALVAVVFALGEWKPMRKFFHYFPPLIWCYFLPMISTTLGITPEKNSLYGWFTDIFLPPTLLLLLISADIKAILRLGPKAIGIMLAGSVGVVLGGLVGYSIYANQLDPEAWKLIGALTGSWTGGSANMFAVVGALEVPQDVFAPLIIVDSLIVYSWMGVVIALAGWQEGYARRFHVDMTLVNEMNRRVVEFSEQTRRPMTTAALLATLGLGLCLGYLTLVGGEYVHARTIAPALERIEKQTEEAADPAQPEAVNMAETQVKASPAKGLWFSVLQSLSAFTLTVIFVTALGILLSFSPQVRKLEEYGASRVGYAMLFMLLPMFGARANLSMIGETPVYMIIGLCMLVGHVACIALALRLFKAPLFFGAVGSQANMGGPASATVVATTYVPALAPVGVLLGILGGILGTYIGLIAAYLCRIFAP